MKISIFRKNLGLLGIGLVFFLIFVTCDFLNLDEDFEPTGTPYTLNSDIELIRIQESQLNYNPTGAFSIDFICRSKTNSVEIATLPAGLFFLNQNAKVQNLIIVKKFGVSVSNNIDTFTLGAFSVNEFKSVPSDSDFYLLGPVTNNPDLQRIIDIVRSKRLSASNVMTVQRALYQVTSDDSLSSAMVESLNMLPDSIPAFLSKIKREK